MNYDDKLSKCVRYIIVVKTSLRNGKYKIIKKNEKQCKNEIK
jgi:hypothetical protein